MMSKEILPKFLTEKLQKLGYNSLKATTPTLNAYSITLQLQQCNNIPQSSTSITNYPQSTNKCNKSKTLNVFVKCLNSETTPPNNIEFEADLYFANEVTFYGRILPNFLRLEEKFYDTINVPFTSVPTCHHVEDEFIMLDDLIAAGYQSSNVTKAMKRDIAKVVLQQLGRFHAFSLALKYYDPLVFQDIVSCLHKTEEEKKNKTIFIEGVQDALKLAKMSFPKGSVYVEKLSLWVLDIYNEKEEEKEKPNDEEKFRVICHGDLWPNNILIKLNESQIENAVFVDFQGCKVSSMVIDLMSVLLLALDKDTREDCREELIECYYNAVCLKLEELGMENVQGVFSHHEFHDELKKHSRFALAMGLVGLPLYLQESSSGGNPDCDDLELSCAVDPVVLYFRQLRQRKSMRCKNKMLEIIMDVVNQGYLN